MKRLRLRLALWLAPELAPNHVPYLRPTTTTNERSYVWVPGDWKGTL